MYVVNHETAGGLNPAGNALHVLAIGTDGRLTQSASPLFLPVPGTANPQGVVALRFDPEHFLAAGAGPGGVPNVKVYNAAGDPVRSFLAYDANFGGGVSVATGDVTGDGIDDIVTGAGPGGGPHVKVFDGSNGAEVDSFFAYDAGFTGGVHVGLANVDGDGRADIITGAGPGGGPHVKVFDGTDLRLVNNFFAYSPNFTGGVFVAGGDLDTDGRAEIVTGAGVGGGTHVRAFDGLTGTERVSFFAGDPTGRGGVTVGVGDFDGNGSADIVTGRGDSSTVRIFDGAAILGGTARSLADLIAYPASPLNGAFVAATDLNDDDRADIISGSTRGSQVKVFDAATQAEIESFLAFDSSFNGGVHVG
ncbi:FG-GAP repeat protein [Limnoglobus roseus]|uniref:VCBS repeat-containing protein n=1 Tax=Limnoglobus roseus TaxID=2598579 RepID=A0A5C1AC23_9BACT|nr:FG-GAP repeat protein [Limnoglobus roseus]QEL15586.1 VCBS repeat-containing protein [Limnoglobus roseus]